MDDKINSTWSYKEQEVVEKHDHLRPEEDHGFVSGFKSILGFITHFSDFQLFIFIGVHATRLEARF